MDPPSTFLAVDSGTTNTRVWLMDNGQVAARAQVRAGVRDTARTGSVETLKAGIMRAIDEACGRARRKPPAVALAAGMITSGLGLVELPHAAAPVGCAGLADAVERVTFPDLGGLVVYFVRGVRTGEVRCGLGDAPHTDIIRGEETEIFGALETLSLAGPLLYVHLGSHSKMVRVDERNRIAGGVTTLAGELALAVQSHTILSSALPTGRTGGLDGELVRKGAEWSEKYGLPRAFFLIRILEQSGDYSPGQLGDVFLGAIASADLRAMRGHGLFEVASTKLVLSGRPELQPVWRFLFEREGLSVTALSAQDTELAFLTGLQKIVFNSPDFAGRG